MRPPPQDERERHRRRIQWALVALIIALPFMDLEVFRLFGRSIVLPYAVTIALIVLVVSRPSTVLDQLRRDHAAPFLLCWFVLTIAATVLLFVENHRPEILSSNLTQLASIGLMIAHYVFIAAALSAQPLARVQRLVDLFVVVAAFGGVLSVYQVGSVVYGWPYAEAWRTSDLYFKSNTLNWHGGGSWIAFPRAYGTAPEPTFWAAYFVVALAVLLGRFSAPWGWRQVIALFWIGAGLVSTLARAAVLPLGVLLAVWIWCRVVKRAPAAAVAALLLTAAAATIWPAFIDPGVFGLWADNSAIERMSSQLTGLRIVADYPFVGAGPGSVPFLVDKYLVIFEGRQAIGFTRLYSFTLVVLVASGLIGLMIFGAFLFELARPVGRALRLEDPIVRSLALSAFLAFVVIIVSWIVSPGYNMSYIWFCLALAGSVPRLAARPSCSTSVST